MSGRTLGSFALALAVSTSAAFAQVSTKPIARWDQVPLQSFASTMKVGVVAFHEAGVTSVAFQVQQPLGTTVTTATVTTPSLNSETGLYDYWTTLTASNYTSGNPIYVTATITGGDSSTRTLSGCLTGGGAFDANCSTFYNGQHTLVLFPGATTPATVYADAVNGLDSSGRSGSTSDPFQTVEYALTRLYAANSNSLDGCVVKVKAGTYPDGIYGVNDNATSARPFTVQADDGVSAGNVIFTGANDSAGANRPKPAYCHVKGVTFQPCATCTLAFEGYTDHRRFLWADHCRFVGGGSDRWAQRLAMFNDGPKYAVWVTDCTFEDCWDGPRSTEFVRGVSCNRLGDDAYSNCYCVLNSQVDDINRGTDTSIHPDFVDIDDPGRSIDNCLFYCVRATNAEGQGFAFENATSVANTAIVNCLVAKPYQSTSAFESHFMLSVRHLLIWNSSFADQTWDWRVDVAHGATFDDIDVKSNIFFTMGYYGQSPSDICCSPSNPHRVFDYNYYIDVGWQNFTPGSHVSTGGTETSVWIDPANGVYIPRSCIPTAPRLPGVIADAAGYLRKSDTAEGAFAAQPEYSHTCNADFDGDGSAGTDADIEAYFACLSGNCCSTCGSADFDGDGDSGTDYDTQAFFAVLGGGCCPREN